MKRIFQFFCPALFFLLVICGAFGAELYGQEVRKVPVDKVKKNHFLYVIGTDGEEALAGITTGDFLQSDRKISVLRVGLDSEQKAREQVLKSQTKGDILYTFHYGDRLLTLEYDDKALDNGRYMLQLSAYDKEFKNTKNITDTVGMSAAVFRYDLGALFKNYLSSQSGKWRRSYIFSHKPSADRESALVMLDNPYQTASPRQLYFFTLNKELSSLTQHEISLPAVEPHLLVEDYALANDGTVYLLASGFSDSNFKKGPATFQYHFFKFDPRQNELKELSLPMENHFVTNLGLTVGKDNKPVLAGLFTNGSSMEAEGIVMYNSGAEGEMQSTYHPLTEEIAGQLNEENGSKEKKVNEFAIRHIFAEENGDITFFAEHYSRKLGVGVKLSLLSGISPEPQLEDHYGDILVARLKPTDGSLLWTRLIQKDQKSVGENIMFNSFALARNGSGYGLVFNDEVKNMSDVRWVQVTDQGELNEKLIFDKKNDRLRVAPMLAQSSEKGLLTIPAIRFGSSMLVRIEP